ncbi:MAG: hypothetical protein COC23_00145 [Hyphomicrobiales bacterium]|nr:MAG: hypothetical protein COC23_00145 [Hyphomicrobiales bacterium]
MLSIASGRTVKHCVSIDGADQNGIIMITWLKIWTLPVGFVVGWLILSANDWNFGFQFLSRHAFDQFLGIYSSALGVEVDELPGMLGKALLLDSWLIAAFIAFRKRKVLFPWIARKLQLAKA